MEARQAEAFGKNHVLDCMIHQNHIYRSLPYFFGAVSLRYLKYHLPGYSPHFAPNKTELGTPYIVHFFKVNTLESLYILNPFDDPPNLT